MLYLGRVIDNKEFGTNGTIEVLIPQKYKYVGKEADLSKNLKDSLDEIKNILPKDKTNGSSKMTVSCHVTSPLGNAYNTGMFQLPQVNTIGLVADVGDIDAFANVNYIWIGGLYGTKMYGDKVILPNDDTVSDDLDYEDKAAITETASQSEDSPRDTITDSDFVKSGELIIKTKASYVADYNNPKEEELDFKKINPDNTIVMTKDKTVIRHNTYNQEEKTSFGDLKIDNGKLEIKRVIKDGDNLKTQTITLDKDKLNIKFDTNEEKNCTLSFDPDGNISISSTGNINIHSDGNMNFNSSGKMVINSDDTMEIVAKKRKLYDVFNELYDIIDNLKVTGSPAVQVTDVSSIASVEKSRPKTNMGFV